MNFILMSTSTSFTQRYRYLIILFIALPIKLFSQTQEHQDQNDLHGIHNHNNHAGIFIGSTAQYNNGRNLFTLGIDYTRFFNQHQKWGIGSFLEVFFGDHTQWLGGIPIIYKPSDNLILRTGPGIELVKDSEKNITGKLVLRAGIAYDIHLKHFSITPSFDIDYVRHHPSMVWGIAIGKGF
ncbi:hypothetical protein [Carboxylicivirga sp. RSCT41]|uniref:hypothetical protein n=1 Tax=Carboxylicivirga agarovorans TaxID=3417570 RepID=UPI003D351A53